MPRESTVLARERLRDNVVTTAIAYIAEIQMALPDQRVLSCVLEELENAVDAFQALNKMIAEDEPPTLSSLPGHARRGGGS